MNKRTMPPRAERRAAANKMRKVMGAKKSFRDFWRSFQTIEPVRTRTEEREVHVTATSTAE